MTETNEKTFTQEEVNEMIEKRLKREKDNQSKVIDEAIEAYKKEQAEKIKLEEMSENERLMKQIDELTNQNKALIEKQTLADLTNQARSELAKDGLNVPDELLGLLVSTDKEQTLANMKAIKGYTDNLHKSFEQEYSKGVTPKIDKDVNSQEAIDPFKQQLLKIQKGEM